MTAPGARHSFPDGTVLYVDRSMQPVPGQFVIAQRACEKGPSFKRLGMADGAMFLEAINPDWPERRVSVAAGDRFCGVVIDAALNNLP